MSAEQTAQYDIAIAGGGINGCGVARDAARRGYKVLLCEAADLASATSSASTKLIHGGLRYLEHREFRLVQEALQERERLLSIAPHVIWPLRFVLPHESGMRPAWMVRMGLVLYDQLAKRDVLPGSGSYQLAGRQEGKPLTKGGLAFEYSDCWVDDARFVVLNAMDARDHGADILTRTKLSAAKAEEGRWRLELEGVHKRTVCASILVNATGPWAVETREMATGEKGAAKGKPSLRTVQGSHIVVPRLFDHDKAYIFQNFDRRIVFAIPYEGEFTLIGTTDREYEGGLDDISISEEETDYLLALANRNFSTKVNAKDIVWSYSGVRGLFDDGASDAQEVTRDYVIKAESVPLPLVNIYGGKLTTYRKLAQNVVDACKRWCPNNKLCTTGTAPLPGGDFPIDGVENLVAELEKKCQDIPDQTAFRLARAYGTNALKILAEAKKFSDLGKDFGAGLTEAEVEHLRDQEWAFDAEDILWRRSKLGLKIGKSSAEQLAQSMPKQ